MIKKELSKGLYEYVFQPAEGEHFGNRILAIINEKRAILLDTGYKHEIQDVMRDLEANKIIIEKVIISHFHNDHMEGLKEISNVDIYGSSNYSFTLNRWTPTEAHKHLSPTVIIEDYLKINFGKHEIEMIQFPGHSRCTILTVINNEYIHIADELMFTNDGKPILPWVTKDGVKRHHKSVRKLKHYSHYTLIPGHGIILKDQKEIEKHIENISNYFEAILSNKEKITFEEATKHCSCDFLYKKWHKNIYE